MEEVYKLINDKLKNRWGKALASPSETLREAVLYSLNAGGKRIRPILAYSSWRLFSDKNIDLIVPFLSSIELIHTYSLIHDDLPAMDDDTLRRGKPTNHVVYGEALAILAGDALLTEAFKEMASLDFAPKRVLNAITYLVKSSGLFGMVAGQALDIENDGSDLVDKDYLKKVNDYKTGALIKASLVIPAILEGKDYQDIERIAHLFGLSFQLIDDFLGASSTTEELGKTANIDESRNIKTFVTINGLEKTREEAVRLIDEAKNIIREKYNSNKLMLELADTIVNRAH